MTDLRPAHMIVRRTQKGRRGLVILDYIVTSKSLQDTSTTLYGINSGEGKSA
jgi:hypothetical protein